MPNLTIKVSIEDNLREFNQAISRLGEAAVLVGIPQETAPRPGSQINNASLGYIHEHGSPARNIPARPFLAPGVRESQDKWISYLRQAGEWAFRGKTAEMESALGRAGSTAAAAVKRRILAGIPPPLRPATIAARRQRTPGKAYRRVATAASQTTPLYDTGALFRAISWIVQKAK